MVQANFAVTEEGAEIQLSADLSIAEDAQAELKATIQQLKDIKVGLETTPDRIAVATENIALIGADAAPPPGAPPPPPRAARRLGRRRLYRIREGQNIAGVCTGLAAYADLDVGLVRAIFVLLALFTAGAFILAYLVLMFVLPTVPTVQDWVEVQQDDVPRPS
jgi:phage shock protein PspC (stress-responsive transcriptional regulator)